MINGVIAIWAILRSAIILLLRCLVCGCVRIIIVDVDVGVGLLVFANSYTYETETSRPRRLTIPMHTSYFQNVNNVQGEGNIQINPTDTIFLLDSVEIFFHFDCLSIQWLIFDTWKKFTLIIFTFGWSPQYRTLRTVTYTTPPYRTLSIVLARELDVCLCV